MALDIGALTTSSLRIVGSDRERIWEHLDPMDGVPLSERGIEDKWASKNARLAKKLEENIGARK